jgi:Zn-dependent M16 (insulinase) family peptidase
MLAMAPGVGACDDDIAPLLVAMEYLTALEGDFWVKLRGAGLTYGSSLANSVDMKRVCFSLYRCADLPAAYEAARDIVVGYASGEATISSVGLEAAKSSLAYSVVQSVSTRIDAATVAWVGQYMGKRADHSQWILGEMARVTQEDALCAIRRYIVPLFDPLANVSIACPANKVDSICAALAKRGIDARHVPEDKLTSAFGGARAAPPSSAAAAKVPRTVSSKLRPGAFASMFKCGCPRCDKPSRRGR